MTTSGFDWLSWLRTQSTDIRQTSPWQVYDQWFLSSDFYWFFVRHTGCSVNIVFFPSKCCDFSELWQFCCCSAGVLPAIWRSKRQVRCTHTFVLMSLTPRESRERPESEIYFKIFKSQYLINTLYMPICQMPIASSDHFLKDFWDLSNLGSVTFLACPLVGW